MSISFPGRKKYRPLDYRVIIRRESPPEISEGGIDMSAAEQEATRDAKVVACGPDATQVKPGDRVQTVRYRGTLVEGEKDLYVILQSDIFLVVT